MSVVAHQPRRVSPTSVIKVTPRRNAADESSAVRYDGEELPVLIRLPNLRALERAVAEPTPKTHEGRRSKRAKERSGQERQRESTIEKKPVVPVSASNKKLVVGGVTAGLVIAVTLLIFRGGSGPQPSADDAAWSTTEPSLLALEPQVSIPADAGQAVPHPGFKYEAPTARLVQDQEGDPLGVPTHAANDAGALELLGPREAYASQRYESSFSPVSSWPQEEEATPLSFNPPRSAQGSQPEFWPDDSLIMTGATSDTSANRERESGSLNYSPENSPSGTDYRSGMNPANSDSYRTGMLDLTRPPTPPNQPRSNILDGTIEIPNPTSLR